MNPRVRANVELLISVVAYVLFLLCAPPLRGEGMQRAGPAAGEEFFIISSVDLKKNRLVLKRPTEVTVLMAVTEKTACKDDKGKPCHLKDLRAGDTVFVASRRNAEGEPVATRIRMGYMTLEEVHGRYLSFSKVVSAQ